MARKLVDTAVAGMNTAKVYRDSEWNEWIVQHYCAGVKIEGASYHTDSKADAVEHANTWVQGA